MSVKKLKENYEELKQYLDLFDNNTSYVLKSSSGKTASITISSINKTITLNKKNLGNLINNPRSNNISDIGYIADSGVIYKNYCEFFIDISHPHPSSFLDRWPTHTLEFTIGNNLFSVGQASPLLVLLTEPIYSCGRYLDDFHRFASMKIVLNDSIDAKNEIIKGLYYLNSFYLKSIQFYATIKNLEISLDDILDLYQKNTIEEVFQQVERTKAQKNLIAIEPLKLYNHALSCKNEEKFLFLYRVLEFFMHKARIENLKKIRIDMNITEDELIKIVEQRNEENQLSTLLIEAIPQNLKNKIIKYTQTHNLIKDNKYNSLVQALYKFRNSIVHAKEKEIARTTIPDPFNTNSAIEHWIVIIDEFAIKCIEKYN